MFSRVTPLPLLCQPRRRGAVLPMPLIIFADGYSPAATPPDPYADAACRESVDIA
jgi:hypothetical protein